MPTPFLWAWTQFLQYNGKHLGPIHYINTSSSFHAKARNQIVEETKGDWVLMLDTDQTFGPDILHRMLIRMEKDDLDVLTGMYQFKQPPHSPVLFKWNGDATIRLQEYQAHAYDQFHYFPVECAGAGCLLVKDRVFERILKELKENPFDIITPLGEDFSFFKRLQRLGIESWCDPAITCEHLTWRGVTRNDWQKGGRTIGTRKEIHVEP